MGFIPWSLKTNKLCPSLLRTVEYYQEGAVQNSGCLPVTIPEQNVPTPTHLFSRPCRSPSPTGFILFKNPFIILIYSIHACAVGVHICHCLRVELRRQSWGVGSLLPACGMQGLNPGLQAQWRAPLPLEQLASPLDISEPSDASTVEGKGVSGLESLCWRVSLNFAPSFFHGNSPPLSAHLVAASSYQE